MEPEILEKDPQSGDCSINDRIACSSYDNYQEADTVCMQSIEAVICGQILSRRLFNWHPVLRVSICGRSLKKRTIRQSGSFIVYLLFFRNSINICLCFLRSVFIAVIRIVFFYYGYFYQYVIYDKPSCVSFIRWWVCVLWSNVTQLQLLFMTGSLRSADFILYFIVFIVS